MSRELFNIIKRIKCSKWKLAGHNASRQDNKRIQSIVHWYPRDVNWQPRKLSQVVWMGEIKKMVGVNSTTTAVDRKQ